MGVKNDIQAADNTAQFPVSESLSAFIIRLPEHFNEMGYSVDQSFPEQFFQVISLLPDSTATSDFLALEDYVMPLAVKSVSEAACFHKDYVEYVQHIIKSQVGENDRNKLNNYRANFEYEKKRSQEYDQRIRKMKEQIEQDRDKQLPKLVSDAKLKKYNKLFENVLNSYRKVYEKSSYYQQMLDIYPIAAGQKPNNMSRNLISELEQELQSRMPDVIKEKDAVRLMEFIAQQADFLSAIRKDSLGTKVNPEEELRKAEQQKNQSEMRMNQIRQNFKASVEKIVQKNGPSVTHRQEFIQQNNRSVQSSYHGDAVLDKSFQKLSKTEKEDIKDFIRENARKFRTRVSRNIRTGERRTIDMAETCKRACGTMGIPIDLRYTKPKRQKSKLVMFLDVSGSCKDASEVMLTFMNEMKEVFPGGCRTYVFVNSLYDVSEIFEEEDDSEKSVKRILSEVPTRGVYSDYYSPFRSFCEERFHELTKDSVVFFIGDARNNSNPSGEEYIRAISRRVRKAYWLNTDQIAKWNQGDSIFDVYAKYMDDYCECRDASQLIDFLTNVG